MIRIALFLSFFSFACNTPIPPIIIPAGAVQRTIQLKGVDAELSIYFPGEMDSLATWEADCCTGGSPAYGFRDREFQILQALHGECINGFIPDSIRQVTVFFHDYRFQDTTVLSEAFIDKCITNIKNQQWMSYRRTLPILFKGIEHCGETDAAYFAFNSFTINTITNKNRLPHETLVVFGKSGDNSAIICFECVGSNCAGFAAKMLPYARTLEFRDTGKPGN